MKWICLSLIAIVSIYQRNKVVKSLKKSDALDWFAFMHLVFPGQDWSTYETKVAGNRQSWGFSQSLLYKKLH